MGCLMNLLWLLLGQNLTMSIIPRNLRGFSCGMILRVLRLHAWRFRAAQEWSVP